MRYLSDDKNLDAFTKSSGTSTEKLSPFKFKDLIFKPSSSALSSSISSIDSKIVFFDFAKISKAFGLNEIIDKCFLIFLIFFLNSNGIFALDR